MKIKLSNKIRIYRPPDTLLNYVKTKYTLNNPKWLSNHKMGRYNHGTPRYLHMYEEAPHQVSIPIGGGEDLFQHLTSQKTAFDIYDTRLTSPVQFTFKGQLKPFQQKAARNLLQYDVGTLEAPTGAGKTVMGLWIIAQRSQKTLILVHTKDLAHQWISRAATFLGLRPVEIGLLGDGQKQIGRRLTIGMIQTVCRMSDEIRDEFGMVIADECHRAPSRMFTEALNESLAKYRLGLSATPFRRDGLNQLINWYCGNIRAVVNKQALVESGDVLQPIFIMRASPFIPLANPIAEYSTMLSELTQDNARNNLIIQDVVRTMTDPDNITLVLSDRKEHCYELERGMQERGLAPLVLTGDTKKAERMRTIQKIESGHRLLIATGQLIGEGFDCKELNTLFICSPIKYPGRVIQYIGRIMRPAPGKERPVVYDYVEWEVGVLRASAKSRMRVYGKDNIIYR